MNQKVIAKQPNSKMCYVCGLKNPKGLQASFYELENGEVDCPVLLQFCDLDIANPPSLIQDAEKRLGDRAEIIRYPIDHFDVYLGSNFERAAKDQLEFLKNTSNEDRKERDWDYGISLKTGV